MWLRKIIGAPSVSFIQLSGVCVCLFVLQATKAGVEAWERGYVCVASFPGLHPSFCHLQYEKRRDISTLFVLQVTKAGVEAWEQGYMCVGL